MECAASNVKTNLYCDCCIPTYGPPCTICCWKWRQTKLLVPTNNRYCRLQYTQPLVPVTHCNTRVHLSYLIFLRFSCRGLSHCYHNLKMCTGESGLASLLNYAYELACCLGLCQESSSYWLTGVGLFRQANI